MLTTLYRVLAELSSKLSVLVKPTQMYQICLMTGLAGGNMEPSLLLQREVLMNIALEHNMVGLIVSAVFDWADGKYSKVFVIFFVTNTMNRYNLI